MRLADNDAILRAMDKLPAHQQHVAFIFDDSAEGQRGLQIFMREGPPNLRGTLQRNLPLLQAHQPRYIGFLGKPAFTGGCSMAAHDEIDLMDQLIPALLKRVIDQSGLCAFGVVAATERIERIRARIAELQPYVDASGSILVPQKLRALLAASEVELLPPVFGGTPIPYDSFSMFPPAIERLSPVLEAAASGWLAAGNAELASQVMRPHAEVLKDGSLALAVLMHDRSVQRVDIGPSEWESHSEHYRSLARQVAVASGSTDTLH